jgi:steroid delta-isomerase-like uncharacterized protein
MSEMNKMIVRRVIEYVWNQADYSVVGELIARDYVGHSSVVEGETHGPEGFQQYFQEQRRAFADIHYTVEDLVVEGDRVAARWTARATHTGEFQGMPATARNGRVDGISIFRVANGCIVECWTNYDSLGLIQQLGLLPTQG